MGNNSEPLGKGNTIIIFDENDIKQLQDIMAWVKELLSIIEKNLNK